MTWTFGDYFRALGVPLKAGRSFTSDEDAQLRQVAVVSESLARHYWPGQDAIGKRIKWGGNASAAPPWMTIIGVAGGDVKDGAIRDDPEDARLRAVCAAGAGDRWAASGIAVRRELRIALLSGSDASTLISAGRGP